MDEKRVTATKCQTINPVHTNKLYSGNLPTAMKKRVREGGALFVLILK